MKHKTISYQSAKLLEYLNQQNKKIFTIADALAILNDSNEGTIRELLRSMAVRGLLLRIKSGLYSIIPYESNHLSYYPNWHLTAQAIAQPKEYYIGFYSALDIHGLITQPSLIEQVVVIDRIQPNKQTIRNVQFEFITFNKNHFFGYKKQWIDDFNQVLCSDLEKTIIDCLYIPRYAGGITEIIKAIYKARNRINTNKLNEYLQRFKTQVVYKRLGYILQNLDLFEIFRKDLTNKITDAYAPLDPLLPKEGSHNSIWRILDNTDIKSVIQSIKT